jgi:hypothetical protein
MFIWKLLMPRWQFSLELGTKSMSEVDRMLKNSQTKIVVPVITLGLVREYVTSKQIAFTDMDWTQQLLLRGIIIHLSG